MGKLIVISAPSGAGKTSIVHYLLDNLSELSFSVSACSREKRDKEIDGIDYHFLGLEGLQQKIKENAFLEWEEVYENQYYGTLISEIESIWKEGKVVIFDVDVEGGINIKKKYANKCLSIFIMPPSFEVLEHRLKDRGSESTESLQKRLGKARKEINKNREFDNIILNDNFNIACEEAIQIISKFIKN